ncbi:MAG TPA: 16S rRNA (cytosine(1402)-N(4))-methyltransferase [Tepidisphaeraceae bacterium]|nr:16S rRNA (cytosine(1402)-N(4))-methyltransferase [Tepidisphaeraceae bacterium]
MDLPPTGHEPVLLNVVMEYLRPGGGQVFVDCTLGRGGT